MIELLVFILACLATVAAGALVALICNGGTD